MLNALTFLICCQFMGEVIARGTGLPLPGPVIGLVLLLGFLILRDRTPDPHLSGTAGWLLRHFGLLFVPAGVGVITQLDVLGSNWLALLVAIPVSTLLGLIVTGWVMQRLARDDAP
jgi:holin-like protein